MTEYSEYNDIMTQIKALMARGVAAGSSDADQLSNLVAQARRIETEHYPRIAPDPISAIKFRMEQQGLQPRDLIPMIGSRARVSEILAGKRQLTLPMIRRLHSALGIPAESLIAMPADTRRIEEKVVEV